MEEGTVRKNYINILEKVLRVRQACDHPSESEIPKFGRCRFDEIL
jgi:hypothetical protein